MVLLSPTINAQIELNSVSFYSKPNKKIPNETKADIRNFNKKLLDSIKNNDWEFMYKHSSIETKNELKKIGFKKFYSKLQVLKDEKFLKYYDNMVELSIRGHATISIPSESSDEFFFRFKVSSKSKNAKEKQTYYLSLLVTEKQYIDHILLFLYLLNDGKWEVYFSSVGDIRIGGKSANNWYNEALEIAEKGHMVPALFRLKYANMVLKPTQFLNYKNEQEIERFITRCINKSRELLKLPYSFSYKKQQLIVYGVDSVVIDDNSVVPIINFYTSTPLHSKDLIRKESLALARQMSKILLGIFDYNNKILMRAYNERLIENKKYQFFGIMLSTDEINMTN